MRRRSSSAAWTMRAREAATSASRSRRAISWRRRSISAAARAAKIVQRRDLVVAGLDPPAREDAEVADVRPADPAHRDREIAGEVGPVDQRPRGQQRVRADGVRDDVMGAGEVARRTREVVLRADRQLRPAPGPGRDDPGSPGSVVQRLRDERDLRIEGLGDVVRERAEEGLADDSGRAGRHHPQQVALTGNGAGARDGFEEGGQVESEGRNGRARARVDARSGPASTANPPCCRPDTSSQSWTATTRRSRGRRPSGCPAAPRHVEAVPCDMAELVQEDGLEVDLAPRRVVRPLLPGRSRAGSGRVRVPVAPPAEDGDRSAWRGTWAVEKPTSERRCRRPAGPGSVPSECRPPAPPRVADRARGSARGRPRPGYRPCG